MPLRVIVLLIMVSATPALGQWRPNSPYAGRGDNTCESTTRYFAGLKDPQRVSAAELQVYQWVTGYLSGLNSQRAATQQKLLDIWSSQKFGWSNFFAEYCGRNPKKYVGDGMAELIKQLPELR